MEKLERTLREALSQVERMDLCKDVDFKGVNTTMSRITISILEKERLTKGVLEEEARLDVMKRGCELSYMQGNALVNRGVFSLSDIIGQGQPMEAYDFISRGKVVSVLGSFISPSNDALAARSEDINRALMTLDAKSLAEVTSFKEAGCSEGLFLCKVLGINSGVISDIKSSAFTYLPKTRYFLPINTDVQKEFWGRFFTIDSDSMLIQYEQSGAKRIAKSSAIRAYPIGELLLGYEDDEGADA